MEMAKGVHKLSEDETAVSLMQEYVRDQYCSIDALDILRSICVTGGIRGGEPRENLEQVKEETTARVTISTVHRPNPSHHTQIFLGENLVV